MLVCNMRNLAVTLESFLQPAVFLYFHVSMDAQDHYPGVYPGVTQTHRSNSSFVTNCGISGSEPSPDMDQAVEPGHHQELEEIDPDAPP